MEFTKTALANPEPDCATAKIKRMKDEIERLSRAFPFHVAAGTRYPEKQLAGLGI